MNLPEGMTEEDFKAHLCDILRNWRAEDLFDSVVGVYELVAAHFKNDVIDLWSETQAIKNRKW